MKQNNGLVVIHQPDFLPYLGFFHRLLIADIYIVLDNVQFVSSSSSWNNRDKIKTPQGAKWITVPVKKCPRNTMINKVVISCAVDWKKNHLAQYRLNYLKTKHFDEVYSYLEELYRENMELFSDFSYASIEMLMQMLGVNIPVVFSSSLNVEGTSNTRIANLVKAVGSSRYLSGIGARDYFEPRIYEEKGVEVVWQDFAHPVYPQLHGEFIPYLSSIDLLFNCGIQESRDILRRCLK